MSTEKAGTNKSDVTNLSLPPVWREIFGRIGLVAAAMFAIQAASLVSRLNFLDREHMVFLSLIWYAVAFGLLILAVVGGLSFARLNGLIILVVLGSILLMGYANIRLTPVPFLTGQYLTDILAYSHEATDLLLAGENPYDVTGSERVAEVNAKWNLEVFGASYLQDGKAIERLVNYPAGHFLVFVPSLALGLEDVRWTVLLFSALTVALIWQAAPEGLRPLATLPLLVNFAFVSGSPAIFSDHLWLAPLAAMILCLPKRLWLAAVLFGIAMAIKQQPWLLAPFLLIWIWRTTEEQPLLATAQFAAISAGVFALFNLPFILLSPANWLGSIFYIATADFPTLGVGPAALEARGILSIDRAVFLIITAVAGVVFVVAYWLFFERLRYAVWVFPAILLWLGYRSLNHYFLFWPPLLLLGLFLAWRQVGISFAWTNDVEPSSEPP